MITAITLGTAPSLTMPKAKAKSDRDGPEDARLEDGGDNGVAVDDLTGQEGPAGEVVGQQGGLQSENDSGSDTRGHKKAKKAKRRKSKKAKKDKTLVKRKIKDGGSRKHGGHKKKRRRCYSSTSSSSSSSSESSDSSYDRCSGSDSDAEASDASQLSLTDEVEGWMAANAVSGETKNLSKYDQMLRECEEDLMGPSETGEAVSRITLESTF